MPLELFSNAIQKLAISEEILNSREDFYGWPLRRLLEEYSGLSADGDLRSPRVRPAIVVHNKPKLHQATLGDLADIVPATEIYGKRTTRKDPTEGGVKWNEVTTAAPWILICESLLIYYQKNNRKSDFFKGVGTFFPTNPSFWNKGNSASHLIKSGQNEMRKFMMQSLRMILLSIMASKPIPLRTQPLLNSNPDKPDIRVKLCSGGPQNPVYKENDTATRAIAAFFKIYYTHYFSRLENCLKTPLAIQNETIEKRMLVKLLDKSIISEDEKQEALRLLLDGGSRSSFVITHVTPPLDKLMCNPTHNNSASYENPKPYPFSKQQPCFIDQVFEACLCHELFLQITRSQMSDANNEIAI